MSEAGETALIVSEAIPQSEQKPAGSVGGWLILVMLWLLLVPLMESPNLWPNVTAVVSILPRLPSYAAGLLVGRLVINTFLAFVAPILLVILMLGYRKSFPRRFIAWALACSAFALFNVGLNYWAAQTWAASGKVWHAAYLVRPLLTVCISLGVAIPYMLKSRRVKNTFVN